MAVTIALAACDAVAPSVGPSPSPTSDVFADRPAVQMDTTWTAAKGQWTFTGSVDPQGAATDVVFEIGPGPETLRQFDTQLPVVQQLTAAGPLTITTGQIPNIPLICVRFTATNEVGTSFSTPLCFLHDLPTIPPPGAPTVRIDQVAPAANGQWTVSAYIDPKGAATDAVLDVGTGPASAPTFTSHISMTKGMTEAATLQVTTAVPQSAEVCIRVIATNSIGTTSSAPSCFSPVAPS